MRSFTIGLLILTFLSGCGPSADVLKKQQEKEDATLEKAFVDSPGMSAGDRAARRRRIELQYGPEAAKKYDEMNRQKSSK